MNSAAPVWITGVGALSCLGSSVDSLWQAVLENRSGIRDGIGRVEDVSSSDKKALAFCVVAVHEAMKQAGWDKLNPGDGLILATTTGQILEWDSAFIDF